MKKQSTGILESLSNSQKPFLGLSIGKTIENQKSISNTEETWINKILQDSTQCIYARSAGGGAAN